MHSFNENTIYKTIVGNKQIRASKNGASYITAMIHSLSVEHLHSVKNSGMTTIDEMDEFLIQTKLTYFWKIGTVEPRNRPWDRCSSLGSLIVSGRDNCITTVKMHNLVKKFGGHVLMVMYPIMDIASEPQLLNIMTSDHPAIIIDNIPSSTRSSRIKQNVWTNNLSA